VSPLSQEGPYPNGKGNTSRVAHNLKLRLDEIWRLPVVTLAATRPVGQTPAWFCACCSFESSQAHHFHEPPALRGISPRLRMAALIRLRNQWEQRFLDESALRIKPGPRVTCNRGRCEYLVENRRSMHNGHINFEMADRYRLVVIVQPNPKHEICLNDPKNINRLAMPHRYRTNSVFVELSYVN
jgi:hypothetical protein